MAFEDVARRMQERDAKAIRLGSAYTEAADRLIEVVDGQPRGTWQTPLPDTRDPRALRRANVTLYAGLVVMLLSACAAIGGELADRTITRLLLIPIAIGGMFWIRGMLKKHELS